MGFLVETFILEQQKYPFFPWGMVAFLLLSLYIVAKSLEKQHRNYEINIYL
jgi:hypothetical protein